MHGGLDTVGVHCREVFDVAENAVELVAERDNLGRIERVEVEPRELGGVVES